MTTALLDELISKHKKEVTSRLQKLHDAYVSDHEILHQKEKPKYKPDNRIVVNFPKYIVDTMDGFFIGNPIKVIAEDSAVAEFVEHIDQYNDIDDINAEESKYCSIFGKGYELYYVDENAELCVAHQSPMNAFMVFDDSIKPQPLFFVRYWTDYNKDEWGTVYDRDYERPFKISGGTKFLAEGERLHQFDGVPAVKQVGNEEEQGLFEPVMSAVNAVNKALSEKANDNEYFSDAYLKIFGPKLEDGDVTYIRDTRVMNFDGDDFEKIVAEFMEKPSNDTGQENLLDRLERLIFQISMVANISDENFGSASGIALKYKLQAMSNLAKTKERKFTAALNRRYKLLFSHPLSKAPADSWVQLKYKFTPNIPANLLEEAEIAAKMEGITSQETQLKVLSIVDSVQEELNKIEEENEVKRENLPDVFNFGNHNGDGSGNGEDDPGEGLNNGQ